MEEVRPGDKVVANANDGKKPVSPIGEQFLPSTGALKAPPEVGFKQTVILHGCDAQTCM